MPNKEEHEISRNFANVSQTITVLTEIYWDLRSKVSVSCHTMKLRVSATDRMVLKLTNWNLSRLGGTRKYNVDFVNELIVLNESSSSRVFVILTNWSFGPQKIMI